MQMLENTERASQNDEGNNARQTPALRKQAAAESCELTPHNQGMSSQWSPSGVPWL